MIWFLAVLLLFWVVRSGLSMVGVFSCLFRGVVSLVAIGFRGVSLLVWCFVGSSVADLVVLMMVSRVCRRWSLGPLVGWFSSWRFIV